MKRTWLYLLGFCIFSEVCNSTLSAQGTAFTYQGSLIDGGRAANSTYDLEFGVFSGALGNNLVAGPLTYGALQITQGVFTVTLDFGANVFTGAPRWLGISMRRTTIPGNPPAPFETLVPRQPINATPYAATAGRLTGTVLSNSLSGVYGNPLTFNHNLNQFVGTFTGNGTGVTNVNANTLAGFRASDFWRLLGNGGTSPGTHFLGTTDNQALEFKINNQRAYRLEPTTNAPNLIGGHPDNYANNNVTGVTISGGGSTLAGNLVDFATSGGGTLFGVPHFATIGGGAANSILAGTYATIGGGVSNRISVHRPVVVDQNTIGGGANNRIGESIGSSIGGGFGNLIAGETYWFASHSAIGGGSNNIIIGGSPQCTIAGGGENRITEGSSSSIGGGTYNTVTVSREATIAGGTGHDILFNSHAAAIGGGSSNIISNGSIAATIGGGRGNYIIDNSPVATIPGGENNAAASYAFAAGRRAKANHTGAFVWADSQDSDFSSTDTNQVNFRCQRGVRFTSGSGLANQTVAWAPGNASWTFSSDRALKERVQPVETRGILEKIAQLPLAEWSYRGHAQKHIGPMAQDFHALFPLNDDDKTLDTGDLHGVTLAALQGLNQKVESENAALRSENSELKQRVSRLEEAVAKLLR